MSAGKPSYDYDLATGKIKDGRSNPTIVIRDDPLDNGYGGGDRLMLVAGGKDITPNMGPEVESLEAARLRIKMLESSVLRAAQEKAVQFLHPEDIVWLPELESEFEHKAMREGFLVFQDFARGVTRYIKILRWQGLRFKVEITSAQAVIEGEA